MGAMSLVMDSYRGWSKGPIIRFVSHIFFGTILALIAITNHYNSGLMLMLSPGMIPVFLGACLFGKLPLPLPHHKEATSNS